MWVCEGTSEHSFRYVLVDADAPAICVCQVSTRRPSSPRDFMYETCKTTRLDIISAQGISDQTEPRRNEAAMHAVVYARSIGGESDSGVRYESPTETDGHDLL